MDTTDAVLDAGTTVVPAGTGTDLPAWARTAWEAVGSTDAVVAGMDAQGVTVRLVRAARVGTSGRPGSAWVDREAVGRLVEAAPERLRGVWGYAPEEGWRGCVELEDAVRTGRFVAAHVAPASFGLTPDDRRLYPLYAKCADLGVPVQIDVGSRPLLEGQPRLPSHGRPQALDDVACDFPSLRMVALGTGWPWTTEMIAVANKHEGITVAAQASEPAQWDAAMREFARAWGREKMMVAMEGATAGEVVGLVDGFDLPAERRSALLRGNAERVFAAPAQRG